MWESYIYFWEDDISCKLYSLYMVLNFSIVNFIQL